MAKNKTANNNNTNPIQHHYTNTNTSLKTLQQQSNSSNDNGSKLTSTKSSNHNTYKSMGTSHEKQYEDPNQPGSSSTNSINKVRKTPRRRRHRRHKKSDASQTADELLLIKSTTSLPGYQMTSNQLVVSVNHNRENNQENQQHSRNSQMNRSPIQTERSSSYSRLLSSENPLINSESSYRATTVGTSDSKPTKTNGRTFSRDRSFETTRQGDYPQTKSRTVLNSKQYNSHKDGRAKTKILNSISTNPYKYIRPTLYQNHYKGLVEQSDDRSIDKVERQNNKYTTIRSNSSNSRNSNCNYSLTDHSQPSSIGPNSSTTTNTNTKTLTSPFERRSQLESFSRKEVRQNVLRSKNKQTETVAMDCEMVDIIHKSSTVKTQTRAARVSIVNDSGEILLDSFMAPPKDFKVHNYKTKYSGIEPHHLDGAPEFERVRERIRYLLKGKILVGHDINLDMRSLRLRPSECDLVALKDTSELFKDKNGNKSSLKRLAHEYLKKLDFRHDDNHDCLDDARVSLEIYNKALKDPSLQTTDMTIWPRAKSQPLLMGGSNSTITELMTTPLSQIIDKEDVTQDGSDRSLRSRIAARLLRLCRWF